MASRYSSLPADFPFLAGIDLVAFAVSEEERCDVPAEEVAGLGRAYVESIMIDQLHLPLQPFVPTDLADAPVNAFAEFVAEWWRGDRDPLLIAANA
jgi:hypothetical protein